MSADGKIALGHADAATLDDRVERYEWLNREGWRHLLPGGYEAATSWWEAGAAYVHGLYMATILLSQTCMEHLLVGWLQLTEDDDPAHELRYWQLLKRAQSSGVLSQAEYDLFDRLRKERNPVAHARPLADAGNLVRRAMDTGVEPELLLREDAEAALDALKGLLSRPPFGLGPATPPERVRQTE